MKEAKDFSFNNLVNLVRQMNLGLPEEIVIALDETPDQTGFIASVGVHQFIVKRDTWDRFKGVVNGGHLDEFIGLIEAIDIGVSYQVNLEDPERDTPVIPVFGTVMESVPPEIENLLIERFSGVMSIAASKISKIAHIFNKAIDRVARDGNIIKDQDALVTFDSPFGAEFKPVICLDYIPAIFENLEPIEIHRTPMTPEDRERYLGDDTVEIEKLFTELVEVVQIFYRSKLVSSSTLVKDLATSIIDGTVISQLLDQQIKFISFGGFDNWRLTGDLTPNSKRCHEIMDKEVEDIYALLTSIPLKEGVDYWALDLKHLGIYGRNNENHLICGPLVEESDAISSRYNDGFIELLKLRLSMNDNKHLFTL